MTNTNESGAGATETPTPAKKTAAKKTAAKKASAKPVGSVEVILVGTSRGQADGDAVKVDKETADHLVREGHARFPDGD